MFIQDDHGRSFGVFASSSWMHAANTFGNGKTFVFRMDGQHVHAYMWTGINDLFLTGRTEGIAVGGGASGVALWLDLDRGTGFSHSCETFRNPVLTLADTEFTCITVEVWRFSGMRI